MQNDSRLLENLTTNPQSNVISRANLDYLESDCSLHYLALLDYLKPDCCIRVSFCDCYSILDYLKSNCSESVTVVIKNP